MRTEWINNQTNEQNRSVIPANDSIQVPFTNGQKRDEIIRHKKSKKHKPKKFTRQYQLELWNHAKVCTPSGFDICVFDAVPVRFIKTILSHLNVYAHCILVYNHIKCIWWTNIVVVCKLLLPPRALLRRHCVFLHIVLLTEGSQSNTHNVCQFRYYIHALFFKIRNILFVSVNCQCLVR